MLKKRNLKLCQFCLFCLRNAADCNVFLYTKDCSIWCASVLVWRKQSSSLVTLFIFFIVKANNEQKQIISQMYLKLACYLIFQSNILLSAWLSVKPVLYPIECASSTCSEAALSWHRQHHTFNMDAVSKTSVSFQFQNRQLSAMTPCSCNDV